MARLLLLCLVSLHLVANLVMARLMPLEARVALELGKHAEANAPSSVGGTPNGEEWKTAGGPVQHIEHQHRPFDKSIAGAHVILGGLFLAILAAVVAYIWVTRKRTSVNKS